MRVMFKVWGKRYFGRSWLVQFFELVLEWTEALRLRQWRVLICYAQVASEQCPGKGLFLFFSIFKHTLISLICTGSVLPPEASGEAALAKARAVAQGNLLTR